MSQAALANIRALRSQSATEQVFEALYSAILSMDLAPGTKVSEAEVAKNLGVSRQPVRDAFYRLSELNLLSIRPQRATTIRHISPKAVRDSQFIRAALESECLRSAMERMQETDIADLEALLVKQADAISANDRMAFHEMDERFHQRLCELAGHGDVWDLIRDQKVHMDRVRVLALSLQAQHKALREHRNIVRCIRQENQSGATGHLKQHLARILITLKQTQESHPQHFDKD